MVNEHGRRRLAGLTSAHIADACLRTGSAFGVAPTGVAPLRLGMTVQGPVRPVRHYGSVDVFLEAIDRSRQGEILVIDNNGRRDEACIGDLVVAEAKTAGLAGIVVWGLHRDTSELIEIGLPLFSLGTIPVGPRRLDPREDEVFASAEVGDCTVGEGDWVIADADGVIFTRKVDLESLLEVAEDIRGAERRQAEEMHKGRTLRDQLLFSEYKKKAAEDAHVTFRNPLAETGGAIET